VLRKVLGSKKEKEAGAWRKLNNAELHNLYTSPGIVMMFKLRRMGLTGHTARMERIKTKFW
jgi:hypothetical protein